VSCEQQRGQSALGFHERAQGLVPFPIVSHIANEPIRDESTSKSGRYGRICGGTLIIDNVGINNYRGLCGA
jgi:hypothetical protein